MALYDEEKKANVSIPRTVGRVIRAGIIDPAVGVYRQRVDDVSRGIEGLANIGTEFSSGITGAPVAGERGLAPAVPDTSGARMKDNAATYAAGTEVPLGQTQTPPAPTTATRAPVYNVAETAVPGVRKIVGEEGVPLFTNITGPASKAHMAGGFGLPPAQEAERVGLARREFDRSIAAQTKANAELFEAKQAASMGIPTDQFQRIKATREGTPEGAAMALSLGIQESLARGISPEGLHAATQGLAALQPKPVAQDLGGVASLLNAQTAQGQLGLGEKRLTQEANIAEQHSQADSEKSVLKIATQIAADPLTGAIDPTKFATALGQVGSLFGLNPPGGVGGATDPGAVNTEAIANQLRSKGYDETEIQQYLKQKTGQ